MKLVILSRSPKSYSNRRLREAAHQRGHSAWVLDTLRFSILVEEAQPRMYFARQPFPKIDAIIPRIGASITFFGLAIVRQFEQMGVYCINDAAAISRSRDKLRAMQALSRHDIPIPPTAFVRDKAEVLPAIERVGGAPVIIKLLEGTQGVGVMLAENCKMAEAIVETLQSASQNVLIQRFVRESRGRDVRALVVGDRVVAAIRRTAGGEEFRSNVRKNSQAEAVTLDGDYERAAVRAAQIMGLRFAGVDILEGDAGPQVMEVNSSPGLEAIERATGIDAAGAVIEELERQVVFPAIDLKHRLRQTVGYGIAEFHVLDMPALEDRSISETPLAEKNILVLSITRDGEVISNPSPCERILPGDGLLCYGNLNELRALLARQVEEFAETLPREAIG